MGQHFRKPVAGLAHNHIGIDVFINGLFTITAEDDFRHSELLQALAGALDLSTSWRRVSMAACSCLSSTHNCARAFLFDAVEGNVCFLQALLKKPAILS
jgi:hypothetical protein